MFDDLAAYFYENVVASYEEYRDERKLSKAGCSKDTKKAVVAATALYHLREHLPSSPKHSWISICEKCPDYALLGDIANVAKHHKLVKGTPKLLSADQINEQIIITKYQDEQGEYQTIEKSVQIHLSDGSVRDAFEVLTNVMNFWFNYLNSIGVINKPHHYPIPLDKQPKSRDECTGSRMDMEMIGGVRFHQNIKLRKYNYESEKVEPIDLTGCKVEARIYEPKYEMEIALTDNATGTTVNKIVQLTREESQQFIALATDAEKDEFKRKILFLHINAVRESMAETQKELKEAPERTDI